MASARSAWGIDIGNRALKAVRLVRDGDQLRVDDFEIIEHETVLSSSGDNRDSLVQSALANFVARHNPKGAPVAVGVSGQQSFARFIKLPPVEEKKIPEIVKFEAIQQIPFPLDDVEWAYQLFRDPESPDVEVGIFAMRKEPLAAHIKYFTDVDMNVQVVQLSPLAVYNAVYNDNRLRGTTMIVDVGAENTDLVIADEHSIWMRSIPIGGNNFTDTLTKAFKLNFPKAEDLKRNASSSKYARQIFQAMRPVFADLVAEIQRSVGFYSSVHRDSRIKKIIGVGGTFRLPGLQKYLQQNLNLDVEKLDTIAAAPAEDSKLASSFNENENALSLMTAYGLALQAMGETKVDSSLLPAKIRREKMWREKTKWFAAAAAMVCVGTGLSAGAWWLSKVKYDSNAPVRAEVDQVKRDAEGLSTQWNEIESAGGPERARIANIASTLEHRGVWSKLLLDIAAALPKPQPELLDAKVEVVKSIPRKDRNVIWIDSLSTIYLANLQGQLQSDLLNYAGLFNLQLPNNAPAAAPPAGEATPPADANAPGDPNAPKGFLVLATLVTPNGDGVSLTDKTFIKSLLTVGPSATSPKVPFSIPKARIVKAERVREDSSRLSKLQQSFGDASRPALGQAGAGTGFTGGGGGGGNPFGGQSGAFSGGGQFGGGDSPSAGGNAGPDEAAPFLDRRLGEDVRDDWIITVMFVVQLDPPAPAAGQQQANAN